MDEKQIKDNLILFVKKKIGANITEQTCLFTDLDLIGLDADLFMEDFAKEFEIDISSFVFKDYFNEVSFIPFYHLLMKRVAPNRVKKKEFDLSHLAKVVKKGYWFEP